MIAALWTTIVAVLAFVVSLALGVSVIRSVMVAWCVAFFCYAALLTIGAVYFVVTRETYRPHEEFWSNDDWSAAVGREREAQERET